MCYSMFARLMPRWSSEISGLPWKQGTRYTGCCKRKAMMILWAQLLVRRSTNSWFIKMVSDVGCTAVFAVHVQVYLVLNVCGVHAASSTGKCVARQGKIAVAYIGCRHQKRRSKYLASRSFACLFSSASSPLLTLLLCSRKLAATSTCQQVWRLGLWSAQPEGGFTCA